MAWPGRRLAGLLVTTVERATSFGGLRSPQRIVVETQRVGRTDLW